ncbi:MAG: hypothetical protein AAF798_11055 [Bacteroidota bacterium]
MFVLVAVLLFAFVDSSSLFGQTLEPSKTVSADPGKIAWELSGMPELVPFNSNDKLQPRYSHLWFFNDGNFIVGTEDTLVIHQSGATQQAEKKKGHTSSTGLYTDTNDRPPKIVISPDIDQATTTSQGYTPTEAITDSTAFIKLEKEHVNLVPNDTTIWILSFRNLLPNTPLVGQLYLFYDAPIEQIYIDPKGKKESRELAKNASNEVNYGSFEYERKWLFFDGVDPITYTIDTFNFPSLASDYRKALVWSFSKLTNDAEKRLFLQFKNDENLLKKFPANKMGATKFMAVFVADTTVLDAAALEPALTAEEGERIENLGLSTFIRNVPEYLTYNFEDEPEIIDTTVETTTPLNTSNLLGNLGNLIVDIQEVETRLSKAHDPNYMRMDACACPPEGEGEQLLVTTVNFVNDGNARTEDIFVKISIPEEIDFNSIDPTPVSFFPPLDPAAINSSVTLSKNEATREITWTFEAFSLNTTKAMGVGHPDTEGRIVFTMLTNKGVDIKDVPSMWACINFSDDPQDEVCTPEVAPSLVEDDVDGILQCGECVLPPAPIIPEGETMPWWIWLIILLAFGVAAWAIYETR